MKDELHGHHALLKLVLFKGIILKDLIQASIFRILASTHAIAPVEQAAYFDFAVGTPAFHDVLRNVHLPRPFHLGIWLFTLQRGTTRRRAQALRWQSDRRRLQHYRHPAGFRFYVSSHVTQVIWEAIYQRGEKPKIFTSMEWQFERCVTSPHPKLDPRSVAKASHKNSRAIGGRLMDVKRTTPGFLRVSRSFSCMCMSLQVTRSFEFSKPPTLQ
jgi:hypothetical protein